MFPNGKIKEAVIEVLQKRLPTFLYFADYDYIKGEISINDLLQRKSQNKLEMPHRIFIALLDLVGTTPEQMQKIGKSEELIAELEAVSNRISQEIFKYWSQNKNLEVEFRYDNALPQDIPPLNSGYVFRTRIKIKNMEFH